MFLPSHLDTGSGSDQKSTCSYRLRPAPAPQHCSSGTNDIAKVLAGGIEMVVMLTASAVTLGWLVKGTVSRDF